MYVEVEFKRIDHDRMLDNDGGGILSTLGVKNGNSGTWPYIHYQISTAEGSHIR